jgi:glycosyltransferase involved in cell wall biosynthesis
MKAPTISVIIPTYNQADFLREALKSVVGQGFTDWEVIVVNNYSEDHTEEVVQNFQDPRIQLINYRNNGCVAASRNQGIQRARGQYLAFLDSDDLWLTQKLEYCLSQLQHEGDLVCHAQIFFDQKTKAEKLVSYGRERWLNYEDMLFGINPVSTSTVLVKKEWVDKLGGFSEEPKAITSEDYDLWLRLAREGARMKVLEEVLGKKRDHETSYSASSLDRHFNAVKYIVDKHASEMPVTTVSQKCSYQKKRGILFYGLARAYASQKQFRSAFYYFFKSILTYPFWPRTYAGLVLSLGQSFKR